MHATQQPRQVRVREELPSPGWRAAWLLLLVPWLAGAEGAAPAPPPASPAAPAPPADTPDEGATALPPPEFPWQPQQLRVLGSEVRDTLTTRLGAPTPSPDFHVPTPDELDAERFGPLAKLLDVSLNNTPIPLTVRDVDRVVGSPWSLKRATAAKLRALPPRLRLMMFSAIAGNLHGYDYQANPNAVRGVPGWSTADTFLTYRAQAPDTLLKNTMGEVQGHFRQEELIDLGVYTASQQAFFPRNQRDWQQWEQLYVKYNIWLGMAFVLTQLGQDSAAVQTTGYIPRISTRALRVGWYGGVGRVGIHFKPVARAGLRLAGPGVDASAGFSGAVNSPDAQVAVDFSGREHLLAELGQTLGWDVSVSAGARFIAWHVDPRKQGRFDGNTDWSARRVMTLGHRRVSFLARSTLSSDIASSAATSASGSLEDVELGLSAAFYVALHKPWREDADYRAGTVVGGTLLAPDSPELSLQMAAAARALRKELVASRRWERNVVRFRTQLQQAWREDRLTDVERRAYAAFRTQWSAARAQRYVRLRQLLADYLTLRDAYVVARGGCEGPSVDWCGSLDLAELQHVRALVKSLARPLGPGEDEPPEIED